MPNIIFIVNAINSAIHMGLLIHLFLCRKRGKRSHRQTFQNTVERLLLLLRENRSDLILRYIFPIQQSLHTGNQRFLLLSSDLTQHIV